jgi:hypothetical protein
MCGDAGEHVAEIEFRIEAVELGRADQRVEGGCAFSTRVRTGEEVVLSAQSHGVQSAFRAVVIDLQATILEIAREGTPVRERVCTCALSP